MPAGTRQDREGTGGCLSRVSVRSEGSEAAETARLPLRGAGMLREGAPGCALGMGDTGHGVVRQS